MKKCFIVINCACCLFFAMGGCTEDVESDEDMFASYDLLVRICDALVRRTVAVRCGTEEEPCEYMEGGCIQIYWNQDSTIEFNVDTTRPPQDMRELLSSIEFLPPEAAEAAWDSDAIIFGEPSSTQAPYVDIDLVRGEYHIESNNIPEFTEFVQDSFDPSIYEAKVRSFLSSMGIFDSQAFLSVKINGGYWPLDYMLFPKMLDKFEVEVFREINGILAWEENLVFSFAADDGRLLGIHGAWPPLDYTNSQFESEFSSVSRVTNYILSEIDKWVPDPHAATPDSIDFSYRYEEVEITYRLDLKISIGFVYEDGSGHGQNFDI